MTTFEEVVVAMARIHGWRFAGRFAEKVQVTDDCWLWAGSVGAKGHARINIGGRTVTTAYRVTYAVAHGPIRKGQHVHHLCETPNCVNPAHLESMAPGAHRRHHNPGGICARGHDLTIEACRRADGSTIYCRACRREKRTEARA